MVSWEPTGATLTASTLRVSLCGASRPCGALCASKLCCNLIAQQAELQSDSQAHYYMFEGNNGLHILVDGRAILATGLTYHLGSFATKHSLDDEAS